jgi:hypothetical protein
MNEELRQLILDLCRKVDEVVNNGDWPTEEGHSTDETGSCPMSEMTDFIRTKLSK